MKADNASADQAIEKLKQNWDQLSHPNRALTLSQIKKKSGLSNRKVATMLGRPESSIRRLLLLLGAPAADLAAARRGQLSTNELLRRAKSEVQRQAEAKKADAEQKRERQAVKAAKLISNWLDQTPLSRVYREQIVDEVRDRYAGKLPATPPAPSTPNLPLDQIIRNSMPPEDDSIEIIGWYAEWLFRWTFQAFSDPDIRDRAVDLALTQQQKRP